MYETLRNFTDEEKAELMRNSEEMRMFLNNTVPVLTHEDTLKLIQPTLVPLLIEKLGYCPVMRNQNRVKSMHCRFCNKKYIYGNVVRPSINQVSGGPHIQVWQQHQNFLHRIGIGAQTVRLPTEVMEQSLGQDLVSLVVC